jgi:hypothetical protein
VGWQVGDGRFAWEWWWLLNFDPDFDGGGLRQGFGFQQEGTEASSDR